MPEQYKTSRHFRQEVSLGIYYIQFIWFTNHWNYAQKFLLIPQLASIKPR